jgi:hypothetical protein
MLTTIFCATFFFRLLCTCFFRAKSSEHCSCAASIMLVKNDKLQSIEGAERFEDMRLHQQPCIYRIRAIAGMGGYICPAKVPHVHRAQQLAWLYSQCRVWYALWTCGTFAGYMPAHGGGLARGGDRQNQKSMHAHSISVHRLELLFLKQPRRYGASLSSGIPKMSPFASNIRLSADYHQFQCESKPISVSIFYD